MEHRRIEQAKRLLTESTQKLADVAIEVGFGTQSRLTSTFKRRTGFTPGEYPARTSVDTIVGATVILVGAMVTRVGAIAIHTSVRG